MKPALQSKLVDACERLTSLMADPQPGLATWHMMAERTAEEIAALFASKDDARALWSMRVLDAYDDAAKGNHHEVVLWPDGTYYLCLYGLTTYDGGTSYQDNEQGNHAGATRDAARLAAALHVLPELSDGARAKLGERP